MREEIATLFFDEVPPVTSKQVSIPCQKYHINMVDVNLIDLAGIASRSEELMKGGVGYCNLVIWIGFVTHAGGTQVSAARLFYPRNPVLSAAVMTMATSLDMVFTLVTERSSKGCTGWYPVVVTAISLSTVAVTQVVGTGSGGSLPVKT